MTIDLNCDMGESFGQYLLGNDEAIMQYVSSVNIACGFHAGDPDVMKKTVDLAVKNKIAIGAHPGFPDLQGFGRRALTMSADEIYNLILYQVGALQAFVIAAGAQLTHVKPHGALYNMAAKDILMADAIAQAVKAADKKLKLVGLSGSCLIEAGKKANIAVLNEVFADRRYDDSGSLVSREKKNALIENADDAALQVLQMVTNRTVISENGKSISVEAQTVCIHGDGKYALTFAKKIHEVLIANHVSIGQP
jgi:5-oxoprolinase (ATP-hydrolysing) subunit A